MKRPMAVRQRSGTTAPVTLEDVVAATTASSGSARSRDLVRAVVRSRGDDGEITVSIGDPGSGSLLCDTLESADTASAPLLQGDEVVVLSPARGGGRGCVIGRVRRTAPASAAKTAPETILLEAGRELVLRVGEGSITLRADGKILIKGKDLVSHAKRTNRIKGGSVSLN